VPSSLTLRGVAAALRRLPDGERLDLFEELWGLPAVGLSLQVELPKLLSPALDRVCDAVAEDDPDPGLLDAAVGAIDTPSEWARLARAVIARA
jgi:hypothetical protein